MLYDRYYYSVLPEKGKEAYRILYDGIVNFKKSIYVPNKLFCDNNFGIVIESIAMDNPHIYYVDFSCYKYAEMPNDTEFIFTYWYSPAEVAVLNVKMQSALNKMLKRVTGSSESEKEKSVHDLLVGNVAYNENAVSSLHKHSPRSNTLLGVLFYKTAVCEGIAKTTKMLLNMLDIKCIVATGMANNSRGNGPHAWNIVKVDGKIYHLDVTWDIGLSAPNRISYEYYNLKDKQIYKDHSSNNVYPKTQ